MGGERVATVSSGLDKSTGHEAVDINAIGAFCFGPINISNLHTSWPIGLSDDYPI